MSLEQDSINMILEKLDKIDKSIRLVQNANQAQNREIKKLKKTDEKTFANISKLTAITCIMALFFYFHNTATLDENKKQLVENVILVLLSGAGLNSAFEMGKKEKSSANYTEDEENV